MTSFANSKLQPFHAMEILGRAKALEAEGRHIAHLEVGEPGVPPAPKVLEAVRAALPEAQRYTHSKGQIELRQALVEYYRAQHGVAVDPDLIVATMGSSSGFILAFLGQSQIRIAHDVRVVGVESSVAKCNGDLLESMSSSLDVVEPGQDSR